MFQETQILLIEEIFCYDLYFFQRQKAKNKRSAHAIKLVDISDLFKQ